MTTKLLGSVVLEPGVLARLLERLARAAHANPGATKADDVALDVAGHGATLVEPSDVADALRVGCAALGLRARRVDGTLDTLVGVVDPSRPVVGLALTDGRPGFVILEGRVGRSVRVDRPGAPSSTVESLDALAATLITDASGHGAWVVLDVGVPHHDAVSHASHEEHGPPAWRRLWAWMSLERQDLATILVYAVAIGLLALVMPVAAQALVTTVAFGNLLQPLVVLALGVLLAFGLSAVLRALQTFVVEILQRRMFVRVVGTLAHDLPRTRREALDGKDGVEVANRVFDLFMAQKVAATLLTDGVEVALSVVFGLLVLALYHPWLLGLALVLFVVVAVLLVLPARRGARTAIEESKRKYEVVAWMQELLRSDRALKLGGGLRYGELRAESLMRGWLAAREAHFRVVFGQLVGLLALQAVTSAAVLGIGGFLVIGRELTLGQLVAAELIVSGVVSSLAKAGKHLESLYDLLASVDKLGHLLDLPVERTGGAIVPASRGVGAAVELDGVHAGYGSGSEVLRGASLRLAPGERVALAGRDGGGKSLVVELIGALREPSSGRVRVDGRDVRDVDLETLRDRIAVVCGARTLPDTVLENVRMRRPHVTTERVRAVLDAVGLGAAVDRLPQGLRTVLVPTAGPLSDSGRVKLALARALAASPSLLVVDDVFDVLEPSGRVPLFQAISAELPHATILVVSDDPQVRAACGREVRLVDGVLQAEVTHGA